MSNYSPQFKNDFQHSFMYLHSVPQEENHEQKILRQCQIPGTLSFRLLEEKGRISYSMISLPIKEPACIFLKGKYDCSTLVHFFPLYRMPYEIWRNIFSLLLSYLLTGKKSFMMWKISIFSFLLFPSKKNIRRKACLLFWSRYWKIPPPH